MKADGLNHSRSIAILQVITGNFMVPGGFKTIAPFKERLIRLLEKVEERHWVQIDFRCGGKGFSRSTVKERSRCY